MQSKRHLGSLRGKEDVEQAYLPPTLTVSTARKAPRPRQRLVSSLTATRVQLSPVITLAYRCVRATCRIRWLLKRRGGRLLLLIWHRMLLFNKSKFTKWFAKEIKSLPCLKGTRACLPLPNRVRRSEQESKIPASLATPCTWHSEVACS